ncbi:type I 3-dehydroquinate dehydratase [Bianquea renquensis]|jgi:type I 3-dehydroquinase|uniref:Type I 3-dehydroquinate dehydratase n=1 Tax=Bianquea renquensis TaxID=2763661 RepID=A0A926DUH4_9FIRM|nr:type I 3-dehydroquinate dehydratase [Bianquea renquensis]MBC8543937.1 type I 3-dehydroquinate dehydratase [Bianquea renquensis]
MKKTFLNHSNPMLTVMLQCKTPETAIGRIRNANCLGADAYGLQVETLMPEFQNPDTYKKIFTEMQGRPCYVTNYRYAFNQNLTDDELADGIISLAENGATLCDVMGDLFCKHPEELTDNDEAIQKQMQLIERLHSLDAEVLMSSHLYKFAPAEKVLEIAFEQKRRGADIIKIVTAANTMEQQIENLRITNLLKQELGAPFLFLSGGVSSLHRRLGIKLGCSMALCVYEHDALSTASQPLLSIMKIVRDSIDF